MEVIIQVLGLPGFFAWTLIFFFLKKMNPKCTFDIAKLVTVSIIILSLIIGLIFSILFNFVSSDVKKVIVILAFFGGSQLFNTILLFNLYAFVFEYRTPKIEPNLPHWISCILGIFLPFCLTLISFYLDKFLNFGLKLDFLEYINANELRLVEIQNRFFAFFFNASSVWSGPKKGFCCCCLGLHNLLKFLEGHDVMQYYQNAVEIRLFFSHFLIIFQSFLGQYSVRSRSFLLHFFFISRLFLGHF